MKKFLGIIMAFLLLGCFSVGAVWGQCSQEEMEAKARKVSEKMEKLRNENDMDYRFLLLRFNNKARLLDVNDRDAWCELYDQMLLEL